MKNLWPDEFEENKKLSAKSMLEEQAGLLSKLTNGVVYAEVNQLNELDAIRSSLSEDFAYRFDIRGKFLTSYHFNVLQFGHDITLYPIEFRVDEGIAKELELKKSHKGFVHRIEDASELEPFIERVLRTERIKNVIGSIMRLSK